MVEVCTAGSELSKGRRIEKSFRNEGHVGMISRGFLWCIEGLLLALILLSPWAFGCVHPVFELWVAYALAALVGLWSAWMLVCGRVLWFRGLASTTMAAALYALFLIATLQTLELPQGLLNFLSPNVSQTIAEVVPEPREQLVGEAQPIPTSPTWSAGRRLSLNPGGSYQFAVRLLALVMLFVVVASLPSTRSMLLRLSVASALLGLALALFAIIQNISSDPKLTYWYFVNSGPGFGPFINKNHYPFFANLTLGLTLGLFLYRYEKQGRNWLRLFHHDPYVLWILAAAAFILASVAMSVSRGGVVAMILALAVCVVMRSQEEKLHRGVAALTLLVVAATGILSWVGFDLFTSRLTTVVEADKLRDEGRWYLWSTAVSDAIRFPWFGSGGETYRYWETMLHQNEVWNSSISMAYRADNEFLDIFAEYGIGGLIALLLMVATILIRGFYLGRRDGLAAGAFTGLLAVIIHSFLDFGLRVPASAVYATVVAAFLCSMSEYVPKVRTSRRRSSSRSSSRSMVRGSSSSVPASTSSSSTVSSSSLATASAAPSSLDEPVSQREARLPQRLGGIALAMVGMVLVLFIVQDKRRYGLAERWYVSALRSLQAQDFEACQQAMGESTAMIPESIDRQLNAARFLLLAAEASQDQAQRQGLTRAALQHSVMARDLCPLAWEPYLWMAQHVEQFQQSPTRLVYLQKAHRLHPSSWDISFALGSVCYDEGRYEEAWQAWREALRFSNRQAGTILARARKQLTATEIVEKILPAEPRKVFDVALESERAGLEEDRQCYLKRVLELIDNGVTTGLGSDPGAIREFAARVYQQVGDTEQAIVAYRAAIAQRPGELPWRLALAQLLVGSERYTEAMRELRAILVFAPEHEQATNLLKRAVKLDEEKKNLEKKAPQLSPPPA
jgi:tetratricopeptide (TPR) repeat protein